MAVSRESILAEGRAAVNDSVDEIKRLANLSHVEIVTEAIHRALFAIEIHRNTCKVLNEFLPAMDPIGNDDLVPALRLRLHLLEVLREWNENE